MTETAFQATHADDRLRAMPFYIVCDVSGSMQGEPIAGINRILPSIASYLAGDPTAADCAHISLIAFNTSARVELALTSVADLIDDNRFPTLSADGGTTFASPLELLERTIPQDVDGLKGKGFQVLRPAVYFLTDGQDNGGNWEPVLDRITHYDRETRKGFPYYPQIVPFGFGSALAANLDRLVWPKVKTSAYTPQYYLADSRDISSIMNSVIAGLTWSIMMSARSASKGAWTNAAPTQQALGGTQAPVQAHDASPFKDGAIL